MKIARDADLTKKGCRRNSVLQLYAMIFEHKLEKWALAVEASEARLYRFKIEKKLSRTAKAEKKKSCGCC